MSVRMFVFAVVCTVDGLVKKLQELEKTAGMYRGMVQHAKKLLKAFFDLGQAYKGMTAFD